MIVKIAVWFLIFLDVTIKISGRNYCDVEKESCRGGIHIGCKNSKKPMCNSYTPITYSKVEQDLFLDIHNKLRNDIAIGNTKFPKATDMQMLTWDSELALLAALNVLQCQMRHDICRNTDMYIGQNLYSEMRSGGDAANLSNVLIIERAVNGWYNEPLNIDELLNYEGTHGNGHLTQVIWAKTTKVGCAGCKFPGSKWWTYLVACNYGEGGNYLGEKIYTPGNKACTACSTSCGNKFPGLCAPENDNKRNENKGNENKGNENKGNENKENENKRNENKGKENKGKENKGKENKGKENKRNENKLNENKRNENKGNENKGNENKGKENKGNENKGNENNRNENKRNENRRNENKGNENKRNEKKLKYAPSRRFLSAFPVKNKFIGMF